MRVTLAPGQEPPIGLRMRAADVTVSSHTRDAQGKCEGRKAYVEREGGHELVAMARQLRGNPNGRPQSLRKIAADLARGGYVTPSGRPYSASAVALMLREI